MTNLIQAKKDQDLYKQALQAWQIGSPIMSDEEFDKLEAKVHPALGIAGDTVLPIKMWSIGKDQKCKLVSKYTCIVQYKIDGVAILLQYKSGKFKEAYTRGDGSIGQCITHHAKYMDFPKVISANKGESTYIIGEAYLEKEAANIKGYKNARNGVAGLLNHKDEIPNDAKDIKLFVFSLSWKDYLTSEHKTLDTEIDTLRKLKVFGFKIPKLFLNTKLAIQDAADRLQLPYIIDGLVIKVNNKTDQLNLGYTDHHPRFYSAFKFAAAANTTIVEKIEWQVGRTGVIIPVAYLKPLTLDGSTISKATLHSYNKVKDTGIAPGDTVLIKKAGDIIPYVDRIVQKGDNEWPQCIVDCPSCQKAILRNGAHAVCLNYYCIDKQVGAFVYACKTIGVKGIGIKAARDIVTETENYSLAQYFQKAINRKKYRFPSSVPTWKAIQMLGIEGLGKVRAKKEADEGINIDQYMTKEDAKLLKALLNIES